MNYATTANIEEVMKLYNLGNKSYRLSSSVINLKLSGKRSPFANLFRISRNEYRWYHSTIMLRSNGNQALTLFGPGLFYRFKVQEGVFREPPKISGTIEGSSVNLCTLIALLKVYQNP